MGKSDRRVQWPQLPEELLSLISKKHLNTRIDNLRFRSVCRSWRSSIPLFNAPPPPPPLPLLDDYCRVLGRNAIRDGFSFTETTIYLLQPPNQQNPKPNSPISIPWLVRVDEIENGKKRARHPVSPRKMPKSFPKQLNLLNIRITEIGKAYRLRFIDAPNYYFNDDDSIRVVISSSPWSGVGADDYAFMAIQYGKLWFFKLGEEKWTKIGCWNECESYHDIVYHNGQFYAVGDKGRTVVIGSDLKPKMIASLGHRFGVDGDFFKSLRLVKSCGDMFLIDKEENINIGHRVTSHDEGNDMWDPIESVAMMDDPLNKVYLNVFKLNETEKKWERVGSLGDRVLFVCDAFSYSVSARDFSGLKGGCIYFSDGSFSYNGGGYVEEDEWRAETADTGVFSLMDAKCGPQASFRDHSQIFWPPPPWLKPTSRAIKKRIRVQWPQLPEELLSLISKKHLNTRIDNLRFRSVCRSWRSSIPLFNEPPPPPLPLLDHYCRVQGRNANRNGFSLTETTIYLLQPPNQQNPKPNTPISIPWLVRVEEIENGKKRALHPLSQKKMPKRFPKKLNLLNIRITKIGKAYRLRFIDPTNNYFNAVYSTKVVVSSSPWSGAGADDYAVMAIQYGKLWFFKFGEDKWTKIGCWNESDSYKDFAYHKGQFYAVGDKGRTVVIGSDLKPKPIASLGLLYGRDDYKRLRLVESCGDLFLIDKGENINMGLYNEGNDMWDTIESVAKNDPLNKVYLKVYKLNEIEKKWERLGTLGDRVLFACDAFSYSVSARDSSGLKGGCIFFSHGSFSNNGGGYVEGDEWCAETADTGVFSLMDAKCGPQASFPDHSQIFWPPPPWLKPTSHAI